MTSHPYKVIVFDFDGVLAESNAIKDKAFDVVFADYPEHLDAIRAYQQHTPGVRFIKFKYIYEHILHKPYTEAIADDLIKRFSAECINAIIKAPEVKGTSAFLKAFHPNHVFYIVSINPQQDLDTIVKGRGIAAYFKEVICVPESKVAALEGIVAKEHVAKQDVVFIGDSLSDYQSATKAGVDFIGRRGMSDFKGIDAPVFNDLEEIAEYLCLKKVT